jgi:hypothetical protein
LRGSVDRGCLQHDDELWRRQLRDPEARRSGSMTIEGDTAAVERFVRLFPMPEPAAASRVA